MSDHVVVETDVIDTVDESYSGTPLTMIHTVSEKPAPEYIEGLADLAATKLFDAFVYGYNASTGNQDFSTTMAHLVIDGSNVHACMVVSYSGGEEFDGISGEYTSILGVLSADMCELVGMYLTKAQACRFIKESITDEVAKSLEYSGRSEVACAQKTLSILSDELITIQIISCVDDILSGTYDIKSKLVAVAKTFNDILLPKYSDDIASWCLTAKPGGTGTVAEPEFNPEPAPAANGKKKKGSDKKKKGSDKKKKGSDKKKKGSDKKKKGSDKKKKGSDKKKKKDSGKNDVCEFYRASAVDSWGGNSSTSSGDMPGWGIAAIAVGLAVVGIGAYAFFDSDESEDTSITDI